MPVPPLVAADGSVWLVTDATATAVDAGGRIRGGWPYRASVSLGPVGYCPPCDTCGVPCSIDCSDWRTTPILGPDNVLYLLQDAPSTTAGGQISAIGPDGTMRDGWPVVLTTGPGPRSGRRYLGPTGRCTRWRSSRRRIATRRRTLAWRPTPRPSWLSTPMGTCATG